MKRVRKIRFYPNKSQIKLINETFGCCNYIHNLYIEYNQKRYEETGEFITGYDFSKIINKLKNTTEEYEWIKKYSSKAIQDAIMNAEKCFKRFFKKSSGYPKFSSRKKKRHESFFFVKDNVHYTDNKNIIKIPILGRVRITEFTYLPEINRISSGRVIREDDKYYLSFTYDSCFKLMDHYDHGIGLDVGVKNYLTGITTWCDPLVAPHFKDNEGYQKIQEKIIRLQQIISHKVEINYGKKLNSYLDKHNGEEPNEQTKNIMKGESYNSSRIICLKKKIRRLNKKLSNIRKDYIQKLVYTIAVRTKPEYITVETLSIKDLLSKDNNHKMHKYISESAFYFFFELLKSKCYEYGVELRMARKYFASSKTCCKCGKKKKELKLSDRVFKCNHCGYEIDRDMNAAVNLCLLESKDYVIINA